MQSQKQACNKLQISKEFITYCLITKGALVTLFKAKVISSQLKACEHKRCFTFNLTSDH